MAATDSKIVDGLGLGELVTWIVGQLAAKYGQAEVQSAISTALTSYYTKGETLSTTEIQALINNLNAIKILNKDDVSGGVVSAATADVSSVCTTYVQTNYSRSPEDFDGILVTVTDNNNDIVLYVYSTASSSWVDISRNITINIANATSTTAGIAKLYNALGTQTDGGITPAAIKAETDAIKTSVSSLQTGKANTSDVYTKAEVDNKIPVALTTEEIAQIISAASAG